MRKLDGRTALVDLNATQSWRGSLDWDSGFELSFSTFLHRTRGGTWILQTSYQHSPYDDIRPNPTHEQVTPEDATLWFAEKWMEPEPPWSSLNAKDLVARLRRNGHTREAALVECLDDCHGKASGFYHLALNVLGSREACEDSIISLVMRTNDLIAGQDHPGRIRISEEYDFEATFGGAYSLATWDPGTAHGESDDHSPEMTADGYLTKMPPDIVESIRLMDIDADVPAHQDDDRGLPLPAGDSRRDAQPREIALAPALAVSGGWTRSRPSANEERDRWLHEQYELGVPLKCIVAELARRPDWNQLENDSGIIEAVKRYAERHGLTRPVHGQRSSKAVHVN